MAIKCIGLGIIKKNMLLVLLDSFPYMSFLFFESRSKIFNSYNYHSIIYQIIYSLGLCLSISLLLIKKIYSKRKNNKTNYLFNSQETKLHFSFSNLTKVKKSFKKRKVSLVFISFCFRFYFLYCEFIFR